MDSKVSQKGWMAVVVWVGLLAGVAFTSNATVNVFNAIIQALFSTLTEGISSLFSNYGILFATLLGILLIFLIVSAWLGVVTFTFEVAEFVFGKKEEGEEDEEEYEGLSTQPGSIVRYLAFAWGLFYIIFLVLPMVM